MVRMTREEFEPLYRFILPKLVEAEEGRVSIRRTAADLQTAAQRSAKAKAAFLFDR